MTVDEAVAAAADAPTWDSRVGVIRTIPEHFGTAALQDVYGRIAREIYVPVLAPDFAYVHWRPEYELGDLANAYDAAFAGTDGFASVDTATLESVLDTAPHALRIFRLLLGLTIHEFAAATGLLAATEPIEAVAAIGAGRIRSMESGGRPTAAARRACALVIDLAMRRNLFGASPTTEVRLKIDKPDTNKGWESIRDFAANGVPLVMFLHQRLYGGAFRQLLDATSSRRGDVVEDAVAALFAEHGILHIRTGSHDQEEIARRFSLTVKPAPDFVVYDTTGTLRAILECKAANDGGTARDKAARYRSLKAESVRLGGVPLFAVLAGLGWTRTSDALGPVIRDTDGRVFTLPTLTEMLTVQPLASLQLTPSAS
jgi:hypothetical protein